jgi:hypothetical protein
MDDLIVQLRSGVDNVDGGEMGGVVLTMKLAADKIERLLSALDNIQGMGFDMPASLELNDEQWARRRAGMMQKIAREGSQ